MVCLIAFALIVAGLILKALARDRAARRRSRPGRS